MIGFGELTPMLADIEVKVQGQPLGKIPGLLMRDVVLMVTVGLVVLIASMALVWYLYKRRPKKKRSKEAQRVFRGSEAGEEIQDEVAEAESQESRRRYKYRWKRRKHRSRNPTLSETGGLPPPRSENSSPSSG